MNPHTISSETSSPPFAPVIIYLLQGVINYDDEKTWTLLLRHRKEIDAYFATIGVRIYLSEADGYAFLRQDGADNNAELPRLTHRRPLNYATTLLCVLLRERLLQHDTGSIDSPRLVISHEDLYEAIRPFFPEKKDDTRLMEQMDRAINRVKEMGFLTMFTTGLEEKVYEVRRILKAQISAEMLDTIKEKIEQHADAI